MKISGDLNNMTISGPTVRPFCERDAVVCPACGAANEYLWRRILRRIRGKEVKRVATFRYCNGDKPPSEEHQGMFGMFVHTIVNGCSGIIGPHLHCSCNFCHADWYSELRNG